MFLIKSVNTWPVTCTLCLRARAPLRLTVGPSTQPHTSIAHALPCVHVSPQFVAATWACNVRPSVYLDAEPNYTHNKLARPHSTALISCHPAYISQPTTIRVHHSQPPKPSSEIVVLLNTNLIKYLNQYRNTLQYNA